MVVNIIERNNKTQKEMDAAVNNQIYVKDQKRNPLQSLLRSKKEKMQDDRIMHVDTADKVEKKVISLWGTPIPQKDVYSQKDAENLARIISYIIRNEFKNKILRSKGFCLHHFGILCNGADKYLNDKEKAEFYPAMFRLMDENFQRMEEDLVWLSDKFDYRNKDADWKNSKDALQRGMQKLRSGYPADPVHKAK